MKIVGVLLIHSPSCVIQVLHHYVVQDKHSLSLPQMGMVVVFVGLIYT